MRGEGDPQQVEKEGGALSRLTVGDEPVMVAVIVLVALGYLFLVRRSFRPLLNN